VSDAAERMFRAEVADRVKRNADRARNAMNKPILSPLERIRKEWDAKAQPTRFAPLPVWWLRLQTRGDLHKANTGATL